MSCPVRQQVLLGLPSDVYYVPNVEEVDGAYWFVPVYGGGGGGGVVDCASVSLCIQSRAVKYRILKFDTWNIA